MSINNQELDALIQEKLDADNDFQTSLADLSNEDKEAATETKRQELLEQETLSLKEKADKAAKAEELAKNYKIRAEKAEALAKKSTEKITSKNEQMSLKDIRALQDVPDEDIDEVVDFAKFKGVSIAEAKNNPVIQTLLKTKAEERATAQAANVKKSQRGASGVSEDDLISKVNKMEEMSDEEMEQAAKAIIARKKAKRS